MKKIIAILLSLSFVFAFPVLALADGTATLTTTVPSATYTLSIPSDVDVTYGTSKITVEELTAQATSGFNVGKNLSVTVDFTPFTAEGVSTTIPFSNVYWNTSNGNGGTGSNMNKITSGDKVTFTCVGTNNILPTDSDGKTCTSIGSTYTHFYFEFYVASSSWGKALAGDYTSTITFTSEIVAAE